MKIKKWLQYACIKLKKYSISKFYAEKIICYCLKKKRTWIFINQDLVLCFIVLNKLNFFLSKCLNFEPLDHLLGISKINSIKLIISKNTLIPRISTLFLIQLIKKKIIKLNSKILDLGTGCGLIALNIAKKFPNVKIIGLDYNFKSIIIAKKNAFLLNIKNVFFFFSNWFTVINNIRFDIIVSNPPYIGYNEVYLLHKSIFFEPRYALFAKKNGLKDIKYIIQQSKKYLNIKGWLFIEHGWLQKKKIIYYFKKNKFINIISYKDQNNIYRITLGQKK